MTDTTLSYNVNDQVDPEADSASVLFGFSEIFIILVLVLLVVAVIMIIFKLKSKRTKNDDKPLTSLLPDSPGHTELNVIDMNACSEYDNNPGNEQSVDSNNILPVPPGPDQKTLESTV